VDPEYYHTEQVDNGNSTPCFALKSFTRVPEYNEGQQRTKEMSTVHR